MVGIPLHSEYPKIKIFYSVWQQCMLDSHNYAHTHTHPFNGPFSGTTQVNRYQKGKTNLDLNEARGDWVLGWQWHQLDHIQRVCTSLQTDNHTNISSLNFLQPGCSS